METRNELIPFIATHPGVVVREELRERGISQKDFAVQTGLQPTHLNEIIKEKRSINMDIAIAFEKALGISAQTWMNLQNGYEYDVKAISARDKANAEASLKEAAYKVYLNLSAIYKHFNTNIYSAVERLKTLESLIPYSDLSQAAIEELCYIGEPKRGTKGQIDPRSIQTWQLIARKECEGVTIQSKYTSGNAEKAAVTIAQLSNAGALSEDKARECLNELGIHYGVLAPLDKAPIDSYSVILHGQPSIIVANEGKDMDGLAHSLLRELYHIEHHLSEGESSISVLGNAFPKSTEETEADRFARDILIPQATWKAIMKVGTRGISPMMIFGTIAKEAKRMGVSPSIAISRYKQDCSAFNAKKYRSPKVN